MLLWAVIAVCFVACVTCWHMWKGITTGEAVMLVLACGLSFWLGMKYIYDKATTDRMIVSGYVASVLRFPPYDYGCGKNDSTCHSPESWLILQAAHKPGRLAKVKIPVPAHRPVRWVGASLVDGRAKFPDSSTIFVDCDGECSTTNPTSNNGARPFADRIYAIDISVDKFGRTVPGQPSVALQEYYNPVRASEDVVAGGDADKISYFRLTDYNQSARTRGARDAADNLLAEINGEQASTGISLGLILTDDTMYFEKMKRSWHLGKANDFVIVAVSENGQTLSNVNILAWDNYALREEVATAVMGVGAPDAMKILAAARTALRHGTPFAARSFDRYSFLEIRIPDADWAFILTYQMLFLAYMLWLMDKNPTTKDSKPSVDDILETWQKNGNPKPGMFLHPLSPLGVFFLYTSAPYFMFLVWRAVFEMFGY